MPVCQFFVQGRCKFGDKCWNEHTREGGRGGGGYNSSNRAPPPLQQQARGGGGFSHRVWVNPSQQRGGYVQPSSFGSRDNDQWSRRGDGGGGDSDWGRGSGGGGGGFGRRENIKSSEFSFSQNRFSALDSPSTFDKGRRAATTTGDNEDSSRICETIQTDMEIWENSGQWGFSTYSHAKNPVSGFSDLSPEELRLEYYTSRASGNLTNYIDGVNLLLSQWRNRVQELKVMNASTRAALITELNSSLPQESSTGFGSTGSAFGSKSFGASDQLSSFSFSAASATGFGTSSARPSTGFGSAPSAPPPSGFGSAPSVPPPSGFGGAPSAPPPSGFGGAPSVPHPSGFEATPAPSASTFSFAASDKTSTAAPSGFGSASGFSFSSGTGGGFGTGFGPPPTVGTTSAFAQPSASVPAPAVPASGASDSLFSSESSLTSEELNQFKAKRFTLGQIPLKPPPANLLVV